MVARIKSSVHTHGCTTRIVINTHFLDALMGRIKIDTTVSVPVEHVLDICTVAPDMHIMASNCFDQSRRRPHANAPRVARVRCPSNLVIPLPLFLPRNAPEVSIAPVQGLAIL